MLSFPKGAIELRLGEIRRCLVQDLVSLPQLAVLAFQRLEPIRSLRRNAGPLTSLNLCLLDSFVQRMRRTANLASNRYHSRPTRRMFALMLQKQSNRAGTKLRGKLLHRIAHQTFFSGE